MELRECTNGTLVRLSPEAIKDSIHPIHVNESHEIGYISGLAFNGSRVIPLVTVACGVVVAIHYDQLTLL